MPLEPRVARVTPRGDQVPEAEPVPVLVVLRWGGRVGPTAVELEPGHRVAVACVPGEDVNAVQCVWTWRAPGRGNEQLRTDWFDPGNVLGRQPDPDRPEEWDRIVGRGVLG